MNSYATEDLRLLAIDPSIINFAWAFAISTGNRKTEIQTGIIHPTGRALEPRLRQIRDDLTEVLIEIQPDVVYIEVPDEWTRQNGTAIIKLCRSAMEAMSVFSVYGIRVELAPVKAWKGKSGKPTKAYFAAAYSDWPARNEHERDAAMLWEWARGQEVLNKRMENNNA